MWPIKNFWGSNHITGTAEPPVVIFCAQVGYMNSSNSLTYHPQKGHGYGNVTSLKFGRLLWRSTSCRFVSDSVAICQTFCTAGKCEKFATKPIQHYPPHLRHVATLPWKIKNSNFVQIWKKTQTICIFNCL